MFIFITIYIYMKQCIHCTIWQTAPSRSLNDQEGSYELPWDHYCIQPCCTYHQIFLSAFCCARAGQPAGRAGFQAVPHRRTLQFMENESNDKVPYRYNPFTLRVRISCSSSTGRRDVYAIHPTLVYASTTLISVPYSICFPIYFLLPIHYHQSQASQTVTLGLVFKVRCNFS